MLIAACLIQLAVPAPNSIKARRRVANAVKERIRQRFHLSVAEVGDSDERQEAVIGCVELGNDPRVMRERMERVIRYVEALGIAEVTGDDITVVRLEELEEIDEDEDSPAGEFPADWSKT